jgi:hypothetical protein
VKPHRLWNYLLSEVEITSLKIVEIKTTTTESRLLVDSIQQLLRCLRDVFYQADEIWVSLFSCSVCFPNFINNKKTQWVLYFLYGLYLKQEYSTQNTFGYFINNMLFILFHLCGEKCIEIWYCHRLPLSYFICMLSFCIHNIKNDTLFIKVDKPQNNIKIR